MSLGNFAIQEILFGVAEDFEGNLLYTLDQLSSANIEVSSDPTEITDKNGNVIRQIYKNKTATFTATSALLSPAVINAGSGSDITRGTQTMPKIEVVKASTPASGDAAAVPSTFDLTAAGYKEGTLKIIGMTTNGVNGNAMSEAALTTAGKITTDAEDHVILTLPDKDATHEFDQYLVMFDRTVDGEKLINRADQYPDTIRLTLYAALVDPCDDQPRAAYIYIPSFQPDPSMTISLDSESTEIDYTGAIQVDYCAPCKQLYTIFFPSENATITTATCE